MGCSSSTQTIARERSRPRTKPEETNGASVVDARSENRSIAEDAETIPDPGHLHADEAPGHGRDQATGGQKEAVAVKNPNQQGCSEPHSLEEDASDKALDGGRVSSACSDAPAESTEDREGAAESVPNEHSDATAPSHEEAQAPSENE